MRDKQLANPGTLISLWDDSPWNGMFRFFVSIDPEQCRGMAIKLNDSLRAAQIGLTGNLVDLACETVLYE